MAQRSFDPLKYADDMAIPMEEAIKLARKERNALLRYLRNRYPNQQFKGWTLIGQLRKWQGLGQPDGRVRNVYMIDAYDMDWATLGDISPE